MGENATSVAFFDTPLGMCAVAWGAAGARAIELPEASVAALRRRLVARFGSIEERKPSRDVAKLIRRIKRHLGGKQVDYDDVALDYDGVTPFTRAVYQALRQTRGGRTVTYGELAKAAGSPRASRAVGRAMATNPFPVVVPCHRVIGAGKSVGGFSAYGGLVTKAKLLALEGVTL